MLEQNLDVASRRSIFPQDNGPDRYHQETVKKTQNSIFCNRYLNVWIRAALNIWQLKYIHIYEDKGV